MLNGRWPHSVLNVKAVVAAFNQEKALVEAFSVITNHRIELFQALRLTPSASAAARAAWYLHLDDQRSKESSLPQDSR